MLASLRNDTDEITKQELDELGERAYYSRSSKCEEAQSLAEYVLEKSKEIGYQQGVGRSLRTLGAIKAKSSPGEGYVLANKALEVLETVGDDYAIAGTLMTHFCYFHHIGWFEQSFAVLQKAEELSKRSNNNYVLAITVYNMGVNAEERNQIEPAIEYFTKAISIAENGVNEAIYWAAFNARVKLRSASSPDPSMITEFRAGLENSLQAGNIGFACDAYINLAQHLARLNQFDEALAENKKGFRLGRANKNVPTLSTAILERGEILIKAERFAKARRMLHLALEFAQKTGYAMNACQATERLAFCYQQLGEYQKSTELLYKHMQLKSQLMNEQSENRMRDLQSFHKLEIIQAEAHVAKLKNDELAAINDELHASLEQQAHLQRELMRLASTDDLTGAVNRRQVINDGILEMERYRHTGAPFTVTLLDIDYFKAINDTFGHATGDEVLRRLSRCCSKLLRKFDVFGRLGGEEFCIIHHDTETPGAVIAVERLMKAIQFIDCSDILGDKKLTVSMGIAEVHGKHDTFYEVLHDADMALYEAKRSGRATYRVCQSRVIEAA